MLHYRYYFLSENLFPLIRGEFQAFIFVYMCLCVCVKCVCLFDAIKIYFSSGIFSSRGFASPYIDLCLLDSAIAFTGPGAVLLDNTSRFRPDVSVKLKIQIYI